MGRVGVGLLVAALLSPGSLAGQMGDAGAQEGVQSWHEAQVEDIRTVGDKFVQLAEAFPEETYDWRPMEGVRSVRDVMALMVAEFYLFPGLWGAAPPEGVPGGFGPALEAYGAMSRSELIEELEKASAFVISTIESMSAEDRHAPADFFGQAVTAEAAIGLAAGDMHEHLGQAIAYARMNQIVPPWSR